MEIFYNVILFILVFLAISSGITKIMLMQQDLEFFGNYGFTNPILITYGVCYTCLCVTTGICNKTITQE